MESTNEIIGLGIAAPAAIAAVVFVLLRYALPADVAQRYATPVAFAVACIVGNFLSKSSPFIPERHWHWLPYLTIGAAIVGAVAASKSLRYFERLSLWVLAAAVAAWLLMPDWTILSLSSAFWVPAVLAAIVLETVVLEPLVAQAPPRTMMWALTITAIAVAVFIAGFVAIVFGQVALIPAASLGGCAVGSMFSRTASIQGIALPFVTTIGGWAFVGAVEPQRPLLFLLIAPLAPLALWCFVSGPLTQMRGVTAVCARLAAVSAILIVAAAATALA